MKFEVVRLDLQRALRTPTMGVWGHAPPGKFWISGLVKSSLMRFLSNNIMAETCCKLAIVCAAAPRRDAT